MAKALIILLPMVGFLRHKIIFKELYYAKLNLLVANQMKTQLS